MWIIYYSLPYQNLFFSLVTIFIISKYYKNADKKNFIITILFLIIVFRFYFPLDYSIKFIIYAIIKTLFLCSLFLINYYDKIKIFNFLIKLFSLITGIGLIFHIIQLFGIYKLNPITTYIIDNRFFIVYLTHSNQIINGIEDNLRYSSIFDEPGYLATISSFFLTIQKYNLKSFRNKIIFIVGIFTLSPSFYLLTFIYFILYFFLTKRINTWLVIIVGIGIFTFLNFKQDFLAYLLSRFEFDYSGGFVDRRLNLDYFKLYVNYIKSLSTKLILFGSGFQINSSGLGLNIGHTGWFDLVIRLGLILFIYLIIILFKFSIKNKNSLIFVVLLVISIIYRPQIINPIYFFFLSIILDVNYNNFNLTKIKINEK